MTDYLTGLNEIREFIYTRWQAQSAVYAGYIPEMRFQGVEKETTPDKTKYWARLTVQSLIDQQATLSTESVTSYTRRYRDNGRIVLQLFGPRYGSNTNAILLELAMLVQNRLRGTKTQSGIWFRDAQVDASLAPEELFQRVNVICNYERDEII